MTVVDALPHCKDSLNLQGIETSVSSLHWNSTGDKFVTSASDGLARVWSDKGEMKSIMNYNAMVMVSKWNKDSSLIASGG
jgi:WD40 repeat protein